MAVASSQSARSSSSSNAATPAALYDLAPGLPKVVQIRPETGRKAGRGYGLLGVTDVPQPVQAGPVTLDPATTSRPPCNALGNDASTISCATNLPRWRVSPKESIKCESPCGAFARRFPR
jgi:hypothetical protein